MVRWGDNPSRRERLDPMLVVWLLTLPFFLIFAGFAIHFASEIAGMISSAFESVAELEGGWSP